MQPVLICLVIVKVSMGIHYGHFLKQNKSHFYTVFDRRYQYIYYFYLINRLH